MDIAFMIGQYYETIQKLVEWEVSGKANSIQGIKESQRIKGLQKNSDDYKMLIFW